MTATVNVSGNIKKIFHFLPNPHFQLGSELASEPLTIKQRQGGQERITETIIEQIAHCLFTRLVHELDFTNLSLLLPTRKGSIFA